MAESLKHLLPTESVAHLAGELRKVSPRFDHKAFLAAVAPGYNDLGLMARGQRIADRLHAHLPQAYPDALAALVDAMGPAVPLDASGEPMAGEHRSAFYYLPHSLFIAAHGLDHLNASLDAQHALTQRFTAEYSIRPYLQQHQKATLKRLATWADDPSAHVRRLVSEGTRPRLPWASRLPDFVRDPSPVLPLLERLKDDPSSYVRRSVANHLNDIGKDHPALLVDIAQRWLKDAPPARERLVRHALRSAVKRGEAGALATLGVGHAVKLDVGAVRIEPEKPMIGGSVRIVCELYNPTRHPQQVLADLRVFYAKASGGTGAKVFKLKTLNIPAGGTGAVGKMLSLVQMTTRVHHPGEHRVELLLNGRATPLGAFTLKN